MSDSAPKSSFGVVPNEIKKKLTGLQLLTGILEGTLLAPPIQHALDFRLVHVGHGRAVFAGIPTYSFYNPLGSVHGGYIAALLDSCMACAVHSTLDVGFSYATVEIKINYVRPVTENAGELKAEGKVLHAGSRIATAEGRLWDSAGKLYAHGSSTCLILAL